MKTLISITSILFILIIFSGILLRKKGEPYPNFVVALHKIISIAFLVGAVILFFKLNPDLVFLSSDIVLIMLTIVIMLLAITSGVLLSLKKSAPFKNPFLHRVFGFLSLALCIILFIVVYA